MMTSSHISIAKHQSIHEKEGKINEDEHEKKETEIDQEYNFIFRETNESLHIVAKHLKTKETFINTFSKSTLVSMNLTQSIDRIINMINVALHGHNKNWKFRIVDNVSYQPQQSNDNNSSNNNNNNDNNKQRIENALYLMINVNETWFVGQYVFKLLSKKKDRIDILHDILEDMQKEIDTLKQQHELQGIAMFKSKRNNGSNLISWDIECIAPTIKGMCHFCTNNFTKISIDIDGLYRITIRISFTETCSTNTNHSIFVVKNNLNIIKHKTTGISSCTIVEIISFKKNDKLSVHHAGCNHKYSKIENCFILEKLYIANYPQ